MSPSAKTAPHCPGAAANAPFERPQLLGPRVRTRPPGLRWANGPGVARTSPAPRPRRSPAPPRAPAASPRAARPCAGAVPDARRATPTRTSPSVDSSGPPRRTRPGSRVFAPRSDEHGDVEDAVLLGADQLLAVDEHVLSVAFDGAGTLPRPSPTCLQLAPLQRGADAIRDRADRGSTGSSQRAAATSDPRELRRLRLHARPSCAPTRSLQLAGAASPRRRRVELRTAIDGAGTRERSRIGDCDRLRRSRPSATHGGTRSTTSPASPASIGLRSKSSRPPGSRRSRSSAARRRNPCRPGSTPTRG